MIKVGLPERDYRVIGLSRKHSAKALNQTLPSVQGWSLIGINDMLATVHSSLDAVTAVVASNV